MPAHGHINPTLPILAELVRRGDRVIAYATADMRTKLTATGAEFREYPPLGFDHNNPPPNLGRMGRALLEFSLRSVPGLIAEAQSERVCYVMHDSMASWGRAVASSLQLPSICSTSTFALPSGIPATPKHALIRMLIYAQGGVRLPAIWKDAWLLATRGATLRQAGRPAEAEQDLRQSLESYPLDAFTRFELTMALDALGRQQEAAELLGRLI